VGSLPFKFLFCQKFGCSPEDYEERAFKKLLYLHARLFARVIRAIKPDYFQDDFQFIRYLGCAVDGRQVRVDALDFKDANRHRWRLLHTVLKIRVSGRKATRLASQLFGEARMAEANAPARQGSSVG
jgi:hypothetical protein